MGNTGSLKIFLGSSSENKKIASWLQELIIELSDDDDLHIKCTSWWEPGVFKTMHSFYESLHKNLAEFDAAIMLAGEEDLVTKRAVTHAQPRDNIIFELGLFAGNKGRELALLATIKLPTLPSDLSGIKHLSLYYRDDIDIATFKVNNRAVMRNWIDEVLKEITQRQSKLSKFQDAEMEDLFDEMGKGVSRALKIKNEIFSSTIKESLNLFCDNIGNWAKGQIFIGPDKSSPFLVNLYKVAKRSVFSTSIKEFSGAWRDESFGALLLEAHKESKAVVTRVFLFYDQNDVSSDDLMEMKKQIEHGVHVYIFLERFSAFEFPTQIAKDFTIIDEGGIIGITEAIGNNRIAARYFFEDNLRIRNFLQIKSNLLRYSLAVKDFETRFKR